MRIVIVEDEIRIREGISKLLRKIDPSYQIVGEAENGRNGLELVRDQRPDLVITDIKMPEMDGLMMLEELQKEELLIKAIVLSAYSEFAYAQQAIHLGVSEYILKPVAVGELSQSLKNVEEQLRETERNRSEHPEALQTLENICHGLLMGNIILDKELIQFLDEQYGVETGEDFVLLTVYLGKHFQKEQKSAAGEIEGILRNMEGLSYCLLQIPGKSEILVLLYQCRDISKAERRFSNYLVHHRGVAGNAPMSVGWYAFRGLENLPGIFQTLQRQMDWALVMGSSVLIVYPKITQVQTQPLPYPVELEKEMRAGLCSFKMDIVSRVCKLFREYFINGTVYAPKEIKESYVRFLWSILNVAKEIDMDSLKSIKQQELLDEIMSAITYDELEEILERLLDKISQEQKKDDNYLIRRTKSLIHEFYQQGITLDEIAHQLKITPEYLGMQFHKETGCNFSSYMKNYRIKKAKELLLGSRKKLYEIAAGVGYTDPKYFSRVFKEVTGELPAEYRKRHQ